MTEIIRGKLVYNELTKNANGGTELMARRIVNSIPSDLLENVQIIHSRIRDIDPDLKKILYLHDLPNDPEMERLSDPEFRKQFSKIVFVSNWQQQMFNLVLGIPFNEGVVIPNAVEIPGFHQKSVDGPIRLIYHTTPHRGLELLIPAFKEASKHFNLHLDVFSSFNAYGWGDRDKQYKHLFEKMKELPNVVNHGFKQNNIIREFLTDAHLFAYPNIWPETSCIALIEAMVHGCYCLHSNLGALPETSMGLSHMYGYHEDRNEHVNIFYVQLIAALKGISSNRESFTVRTIPNEVHQIRYDWDRVKYQWINLLREV